MDTFTTDPDAPELAQAASLGLAMLRAAKTATWAELVADPSRLAGLTFSPAQLALVNAHGGELTFVRVGPPLVTLAVCPVCGSFTVVAGAPATTCPLTLGCPGTPARAPIATRTKPPTRPGTPTEPTLAESVARATSPVPHIHQS